jgi:phosphoadenosine phosphosulfate reductase
MSSRQLPDTELVEPFRAPPIDAESMHAEELVRWAAEEHGDKLCLTCSWQKQSSVLVHMVAELELDIDVIELDTQLFFRESYETRDALVERYGLKLVQPHVISVAEQHRQEGPNLWERDPDRCCHIRKVEPLVSALEPYDAWLAGIRREQSPSRADTPKLQWSDRYGVWKVNPLADWDEKRVWAYIAVNEIPYNPLHEAGYRSIGCIPCTGRRHPARRSAPDAGPTPTSSSAASTKTRLWSRTPRPSTSTTTRSTVDRPHLRARAP